MSDADDAKRYRFLRDRRRLGQWRVQQWEIITVPFEPDDSGWHTLADQDLDGAIDAALVDQTTEVPP